MDWKLHAEAFYAEWIVKYLQPPKSAWKDLLDQFMVFDKRGIQKFSTARSAVLNPDSRLRYLQGLPQKAKYIRRCFIAFWKMGIKQVLTHTEGLKGESIWNNPRPPILVNPGHRRAIVYLRTTIELELYGDITDRDTHVPRTKGEWEDRIEELHADAFT